MRRLFAILFTSFLSASAWAEAGLNDYAVRLDKLFAELHGNLDETTSKLIEVQIWSVWANESTPEAVAQLAEASSAMNAGAFDVAEKKLIAIVQAHPDFAEAWNRRATLYFMQGRYEESLADISHVLDLEPRHFGALSGKGMVLRAQGKPAEALRAMKDALEINPYAAGLKDSVERLEKMNPEL